MSQHSSTVQFRNVTKLKDAAGHAITRTRLNVLSASCSPLFPFLEIISLPFLFIAKAKSYTFHHCHRLFHPFRTERRGYSNYQVIMLLKHLYTILCHDGKSQKQHRSKFSLKRNSTKQCHEKFLFNLLHVAMISCLWRWNWCWIMPKRRRVCKLRCVVEKPSSWRRSERE